MGYPEDALGSGEELLWFSRRHPKSLASSAAILVLLAVVGGLLIAIGDGGVVQTLGFVVIGGGILWFLAVPFLRWMTSTYTVTSRRILTRSGLVRQTGRDIPIQRVSGVSFEKGVLDRMWGCGTLLVESSAESTQIVFHDVPDVETVQRMLTDMVASNDVD
jgi:membrane protein YdbS with pleckstrin-like domain